MRGKGIPNLRDLKQYRVNREQQHEGIRQTLYDFQTYDGAAGQTQLTFFQQPIGQNGRTRADTNMEVAGSLPAPKKFLVESIEIHFFPAGAPSVVNQAAIAVTNFANDVYALAEYGGFLDFFVGSKSYLSEAPLGKFPPKTRLDVDAAHAIHFAQAAAADEDKHLTTEYASMAGRPYYLDPPLLLEPTQNFNVSLNWPTAVALPSGANAKIGVVLDGILYRLSQ